MDYCENMSVGFKTSATPESNAKLNLFNKRPVVTIIRDRNGCLSVLNLSSPVLSFSSFILHSVQPVFHDWILSNKN